MDYQGKRILVLDGYGRQIPIVLEQLSSLGFVITTLNCSKLDVGYTSKYPVKRLVYPETRHSQESLKAVLDKELLSGDYDYVFPMLEPATYVLLSNADLYSRYVTIMAAPMESFRKAFDKQETMTACMDCEVPCPITKRDGESLEDFISKIGFPVVIKPRKGSGSMGFHIVRTQDELDTLLQSIRIEESVIQQFIPQTGKQYLAYLVFDQDHNVKSYIMAEKVRWYPIDGGTASFMQSIDSDTLLDYSVRLLKKIDWIGVAHIDLIQDPRDNVIKVMEINGRMPASIKIMACADIPFVKQLADCYSDEPVEDYNKNAKAGLRLRYMQTDFLWLLKSPNRFKSKPSWFNFAHAKDMIFSWKDPRPFFSYSISHIRSYRDDMEKRKR